MKRAKAWLITTMSLPILLCCGCQFALPMSNYIDKTIGPIALVVPGGILAFLVFRHKRNYRRRL